MKKNDGLRRPKTVSSGQGGWKRSHLLAVAIMLVSACSREVPPPASPPTVLAALPQAESSAPGSAATASYAGEVRARHESLLSFRVDGKILARPAHLGDSVRAGQVLAQIDPGDSTATAGAARAALAAAENRLVLARRQRERNSAQLQDELVSRAEAEQSDSAFAVAQAEVEQRRQELVYAEHQSQYTELRADHDGYITSENAEVGAVVKAGQAVLGLAWSGEADVLIDVPESRIAQIARGQAASVTLAAAPGLILAAHVRDIAAAADPQSRSFRVKLALVQAARARLGTTATVLFPRAGADSRLVVPASALFHDGPATAVWVINPADSTLVLRKVDVAAYDADTVTLAGGLAAGERIVVQGVHAVSAGERVSAVAPRAEGSPAGGRP
jgi:RND family efflux transporter MFP subunit